MLVLRRVQPGDRVRLVPLSPRPGASLDEGVNQLTSWGLTVEVVEETTHDQQLAAFNTALRAPDVRAVIATGGDYAHRIADRLDFAAVRADPKPVVSTITHIHLALWRECQLSGVYGSVAGGTSEEPAESLRSALMTSTDIVLRPLPDEVTAGVLARGQATGILVGGRLSVSVSNFRPGQGGVAVAATADLPGAGGAHINLPALGRSIPRGSGSGGPATRSSTSTNFRDTHSALRRMVGVGLPSLAGAVLLLTDQRTLGLGQVDRQLTHLRRSGLLDGVRGVALGRFAGFDGFEDRGWTLTDVLQDQLGPLGVPVLGGLPIGCGVNSLAVPTGTPATLDADAGTLTVAPAVAPG